MTQTSDKKSIYHCFITEKAWYYFQGRSAFLTNLKYESPRNSKYVNWRKWFFTTLIARWEDNRPAWLKKEGRLFPYGGETRDVQIVVRLTFAEAASLIQLAEDLEVINSIRAGSLPNLIGQYLCAVSKGYLVQGG